MRYAKTPSEELYCRTRCFEVFVICPSEKTKLVDWVNLIRISQEKAGKIYHQPVILVANSWNHDEVTELAKNIHDVYDFNMKVYDGKLKEFQSLYDDNRKHYLGIPFISDLMKKDSVLDEKIEFIDGLSFYKNNLERNQTPKAEATRILEEVAAPALKVIQRIAYVYNNLSEFQAEPSKYPSVQFPLQQISVNSDKEETSTPAPALRR
jgi:hypothetical protein